MNSRSSVVRMSLFPFQSLRALPLAQQAQTYLFERRILDAERLHVGGEVVEILKVGSEQSRATGNDARCFLSADVGKTWAGAIHYEGQRLDRSLRGLHGPEDGDVGLPDHLPHPQDFGLSIHGIRGDKKCQPL